MKRQKPCQIQRMTAFDDNVSNDVSEYSVASLKQEGKERKHKNFGHINLNIQIGLRCLEITLCFFPHCICSGFTFDAFLFRQPTRICCEMETKRKKTAIHLLIWLDWLYCMQSNQSGDSFCFYKVPKKPNMLSIQRLRQTLIPTLFAIAIPHSDMFLCFI